MLLSPFFCEDFFFSGFLRHSRFEPIILTEPCKVIYNLEYIVYSFMESVILFVLIGLIVGWMSVLTLNLYKMMSHYRTLTGGNNKKNLQEILTEILGHVNEHSTRQDYFEKEVDTLKKDTKYHIQKMGLVRFNPFANTGGEQSFIIALLDGYNSGLVITSLHNRGNTRWYIKRVMDGKSVDHELSSEEKEAVKHASILKEGWSNTLLAMMK